MGLMSRPTNSGFTGWARMISSPSSTTKYSSSSRKGPWGSCAAARNFSRPRVCSAAAAAAAHEVHEATAVDARPRGRHLPLEVLVARLAEVFGLAAERLQPFELDPLPANAPARR